MEGAINLRLCVNKSRDEDRRTLLAWGRSPFMPVPYVADMDDCNARHLIRI